MKTTEIYPREKVQKFWALHFNVLEKLTGNVHEVFLRLRDELQGESLEALEYFYYERIYMMN